MTRRHCLATLAGLGLTPFVTARAQSAPGSYPGQVVRLVAPFPPGGTVDILARALAQQLSKELGQPVIVENRGGAGGTVGAQFVAQAPADGYTVLFAAAHHAIAQSVYPKLGYDIRRDFAPACFLGRVGHVLIANNSFPARTVQELVAYLKANPDKVNYGTPGSGTLHHLMAEQFKSSTGTRMAHVPYKGSGPAMIDLISGQIQVCFETMPSALQHIRNGNVRVLALTSRERSTHLPGIPTIAESGVTAYDASSWYGLFAPSTTPPVVMARLNQAVNSAFHNAAFAASWKALGADSGGGTPQELGKLLSSEVDRWASVARAASIKVE
ncbi:Tripartite-type tricarboxylate transporter, receptor component TctC [Variovorax sp. CF079]|uniref:Bug family tripartite tricarboxylate transporter substrate binding protein n=1 Tax=Variovorax sp. CF079 TaxID=1882774 RepID=UPI00089245F0|nr:tripartite tricarboxylate transporter substrate binding protein [Variovorax sp. CF079]SDE73260.1 Tripartite-type tricarboxylate transporter, receptor component TctC [Variovorax sp. CF079]